MMRSDIIPPSNFVKNTLKNEKMIKEGDIEVRYILIKGASFSNHLSVIFSGFVPEGLGVKYPFNYIQSLEHFDSNVLFISDSYGPRGCYYLGNEFKFDFEPLVYRAIEDVRKQLGVEKQNVICAGSSKGGSAALYYGVKYGYGCVIAGAPQTKIASYLKNEDEKTYNFMFGEVNEKSLQKGDRIIFNEIEKIGRTNVTIITSPRDHQFSTHIKPLLKMFKNMNSNISILLDSSINVHGDVAQFFKTHLSRLLYSTILKKTNNVLLMDLQTMLKPLDQATKIRENENGIFLSINKEDKIYLVLFDGDFENPPKKIQNLAFSNLVQYYSKFHLSLDLKISNDLVLTCFIMQFNGDKKIAKNYKIF